METMNRQADPSYQIGGTLFDNHVIVIKKDSFEHILNCLANQKSKLAPGQQQAVDACWRQGMDLLYGKMPYAHPPVEKGISASEALFGFCGWLTSREKKTVMSGANDASEIAELIDEFCKVNKLEKPEIEFANKIKHPKCK